MTKRIIAAVSMALLAGCATVGDSVLKAGTTGAVRFAPADVDAAIKIAQQAKDVVAEACYTAIRKHVDQEFKLETVGPVSAYAAARVRIRESRAGLSPDVHVACSPLIIDAGAFASSLGLTFGTLVP
jgi:hypothetical protein